MRKAFIALLAVAAVSTSGCAALTGKRATPDEFAVARNAPLIIPPISPSRRRLRARRV